MVSKIEATTLLALTFLQLTRGIEYRSEMVSQRVTYFENPYFNMDVKFYGDEGFPYLSFNDVITPYNDLHLMVYAKKFTNKEVLLSHSPISLCQLLHDTSVGNNKEFLSSPAAQFNLPQIFNFAGKSCPIEQSTIRLSPYIFPANFTFDESLGCGKQNVEARLMKCNDELFGSVRDCETLLKNVLQVEFYQKDCSNVPEGGNSGMENGWLFNKILYLMRALYFSWEQ